VVVQMRYANGSIKTAECRERMQKTMQVPRLCLHIECVPLVVKMPQTSWRVIISGADARVVSGAQRDAAVFRTQSSLENGVKEMDIRFQEFQDVRVRCAAQLQSAV
jgi:hypothetical protein